MTLATLKSACLSTKKQGVSYPVLPIDEFESRHSDQDKLTNFDKKFVNFLLYKIGQSLEPQ